MLRAGAVVEQIPGPKYTAALGFAELSLRAPWPRPATLRKQRATLPQDFELALRAPASALSSSRGALRFDAKLDAAVETLLAARSALAARFLILPTSADLTPGVRSRDLLAAYVERIRGGETFDVVWAPRGAWEPAGAATLAESLGLVLAFDPLEDARPPGKLAYARLVALGARRTFSPAALERVLSALASNDQSNYVAIESDRSFSQASSLERLASGASDDPWQ